MNIKYIFLLMLSAVFINASGYSVVEEFSTNYNTIKVKKIPRKSVKRVIKFKKKHKVYRKKRAIRDKKVNNTLPKLVIIIDDVSHKYQLNAIKRLNIKITPSIFPPNEMNMQNHLLARGLRHFMVHLPLQSHSKQMNKMHKTIFVYNSKKEIENRVKEIRRLFPNAKYLNNHTGSLFSANYAASKKLYKALLENGFTFVDSRTTIKTKFPQIDKEFGKRYLKADLFIDNNLNTNTIVKQLKKGISLAKQKGYAVVIGHPHMQTFKALKRVKKLLKQVNVVYIDELN